MRPLLRGGVVGFVFILTFLLMLAFGGYRNGRLSVANTRKVCSEEKEFNVRMAAVFGSCGFRMWPFVGVGCPFPFGAGHKKNARFVVNGH